MSTVFAGLSDEILIQIFTYYAHRVQCRYVRSHYRELVNPKTLKLTEYENLINVLTLNQKFFKFMAPILLPQRLHVIIPINSTKYIDKYGNFKRYMELTFYSLYCFDPGMVEFLSNFPEDQDFTSNNQGFLHKYPKPYCRETTEIIQYFQDYKRSKDFDYEFLNVFPLHYIENFYRYSSRSDIYIFESIKDLPRVLLFCKNVINNKHSIMKQFVKSFTVDLLFLNDFQTGRIIHGGGDSVNGSNSFLGNILSKYINLSGDQIISVKPSPFKSSGNFFATKLSCDGDIARGLPYNEKDLPKLLNHFKGTHRKLTRGVTLTDYEFHFYRQRVMFASFLKFFRDGGRYEAGIQKSKKDIYNSLYNIFKELRVTEGQNIKRSIRLISWSLWDLTPEQRARDDISNKLFSLVDSYYTDWRYYHFEHTDNFFHGEEFANILGEVVKATTINSPKQVDTSLLCFSLMDDRAGSLKTEGFEYMRPKIIIINKAAKKSE